jgi:hypothetical protein
VKANRSQLALALIVIGAAIASACPGLGSTGQTTTVVQPGQPSVSPVSPAALTPPVPTPQQDSLCNRADAQLALDRGLDSNAVNFARANGYWGWCIPEYDDDQRWSDGSNGSDYGPIAHVLAAPWLDTLTLDATYRQVAIIEIDQDPFARPDPYQQMRLAGRSNCLYLKRSGGSPSKPTYDAVVVGPWSSTLVCPLVAVDSGGPALKVFVDDPFSDNSFDYPPTTRFVEGLNHRTLVGVKCMNRWCMVGPPSAGSPIPLSAHHSVTSLTMHREGVVKGFFDDQLLGVPDANPRYKIHRQIRASAVPDTDLANLHVDQFVVDSGQQIYKIVGRVWFDSEPDHASKYWTFFGFSKGLNIVKSRAEVHGPPSSPDTVWFTQVINGNGVPKNDIKTKRMSHRHFFLQLYGEKARIPATMRWRWLDRDEDLWYECDLGCCLAGRG